MADSEIPPEDCYATMGFLPFSGEGPHLPVAEWKRVQESKLLVDMRQRYVWQRELAGKPVIDHGYVVGSVPALRLQEGELDKLLTALDEGIEAGCRTVADWQARQIARKAQQRS